MNDDPIEPKTESSTDDELLAMPLPNNETVLCQSDDDVPTSNGQPPSVNEFTATNVDAVRPLPAKDTATVTFSSQCLATDMPTITSISEKSWGSHVTTNTLNTEIVVHGSHKETDISTSGDTIIDSDVEIKPSTEIKENTDENLNPECDYIFCIAAVYRTAPNSSKLLAISKIDTNIKVDIKSDGSSLNGYTADHSSSSTNSTICGQIEEPFLIPKVPRDSFMSLSSSSSSNGVLIHHLKSKTNNILLSKNVYTYPENLICHQCNCVYPGVSENFSMDCKDYIKKSQIKSRVKRSKQKKKSKQSHLNNDSSLKRTSKKTKQNTELIFDEKTEVKIEKEDEFQNIDMTINAVENQINEPISFEKGNKVFAYWVADKLFYPATIVDIVYPKYKVEFLSDFVVKSVNADGLVHSSAVKKGSLIAIFDTISQEYRVGEIVSINEVPNSEDTYTIDLNSEEVVVPFDKLVLDEDKARTLQNKTVTRNYNRLSLSNISDGKRLRLSRSTSIKCTNSNLATKSSKRKIVKEDAPQIKKKQKCLFPEERDPRDIPSTSTGITGENYEFPPLPMSEDSDFDYIREDLSAVNMHQLRNTDIDSEHSTPDKCNLRVVKTPPNQLTKVFKDLHMVLSYAKYKRIPMCNDSDQSTDNELSLKTDYFKPDKLHKKHIEMLISKHGGTCHRYLNLIPRSRYKFTYIISDTPSQTCNFFLGLSLGIPCYHHKYIEQAISQKTPFAEFLINNKIKPIPNGWAVETRDIIFRSPKTVHSCLFSGYIIYLALSNNSKNEFFAGLLRFCGAIVYTSWSNGVVMPLTRHITVIVTDEKCPNILVSAQVPKLSIFWVIQSLICESVRPIDGHESYIAIDDNVDDINENNK